MTPFRCDRILVPTDLSPFGEKAVRYAHGLAELCKADLHVLHVIEEEAERLRLPAGVVGTGTNADDRAVLAQLLGESGGVRRIEVVHTRPDVPAAILEYAYDEGIDLIVMSSHGRSGLTEMLFGSVAEQVSRGAPCPVLVVRARDDR
jgi:nucleotide-binding universal stress UspA family protein